MTNKEFIQELSKRINKSATRTQDLTSSLIEAINKEIKCNENGLYIHGFGAFEVRKKKERIIVNPLTKQRMLVPPKLIVNFKPSMKIKDKIK